MHMLTMINIISDLLGVVLLLEPGPEINHQLYCKPDALNDLAGLTCYSVNHGTLLILY